MGFEHIRKHDSNYLIASSMGYLLFDMDKVKNIQPKIAIDKILLKDNLQKLIQIPKVNDSEIDFENNNIHFYYTANSYQKYQNVEYQYRWKGSFLEFLVRQS